MKCPKCQKNNLSWADYCVGCGSRLTPVVVTRGGPSSQANGLPEVKRHLDEMAVRLSKVEGRVTLISQRIGLESAVAQPAISSPAEAPVAELQPEVVGESFPVEVLAPERPCSSALNGPGAIEKSTRSERKAETVIEAASAGQTGPAKPVAADSRPAQNVEMKPSPQVVSSAPTKPPTPEVPVPLPAVEHPAVLEAPVSPPPT
ncbi:MAG TPA: hypothetical protein VN415_09500, partial [Dehalococcoidia bacterium]|nr:hypothetical protein [Dehalococcoidia bacterium]